MGAVGVNLDIAVKFGARILTSRYILITLSSEFVRMDNGAITCAALSGSVETSKSCTST